MAVKLGGHPDLMIGGLFVDDDFALPLGKLDGEDAAGAFIVEVDCDSMVSSMALFKFEQNRVDHLVIFHCLSSMLAP